MQLFTQDTNYNGTYMLYWGLLFLLLTVRTCVSPCMQERESGGIPFTLSLDHPHKLMVLGQSHDYTQCKASVKTTGKRCSNFANL